MRKYQQADHTQQLSQLLETLCLDLSLIYSQQMSSDCIFWMCVKFNKTTYKLHTHALKKGKSFPSLQRSRKDMGCLTSRPIEMDSAILYYENLQHDFRVSQRHLNRQLLELQAIGMSTNMDTRRLRQWMERSVFFHIQQHLDSNICLTFKKIRKYMQKD